MKFFALAVALLVEQLRPLRQDNAIYRLFERFADSLERQLNGGQRHHGIVAWLLAVVPLVAATLAIQLALYRASPVLAWIWSVVVLYLTMGFRQFSHFYSEIHEALQEGRLEQARERLRDWRGAAVDEYGASEIARIAIELGLLGAHRHVFGPVVVFIVFGPAGAMLYRAAALLAQHWGRRSAPEFGEFGRFAGRSFFWLDWLPSRITAASFAIVGNFEDAVFCWRTQAPAWATHSQGVILASGAGAIGVRLGEHLQAPAGAGFRSEPDAADEADVDHMQSAVGLIWRALLLWMFLVLLITIAHSLG